MVTKSKLKMALASEKGVDFKKQNLKKKEKLARKGKAEKNGGEIRGGNGKVEDDWEDLDEESEDGEEGGVELSDEDEEGSEEDEIHAPRTIDLEGIDESDSDSSAGDDGDLDQEAGSDDQDDDEDIPLSDLEDLSDDDKEDIIPHQRLTINNTAALTAALKRISLPVAKLPFSEHQSLLTSSAVTIADVSDDLNRELAFYAQSLSAVREARTLLRAEGLPFSRPTDYFAEMVKADEHMAKIKAKLVDEAAGKKASAEARRQRDLKKFGKQVQVAKQQERDKERKQTLEKIKTLKRKRQGADAQATGEADLFDVALEEETSSKPSRRDGNAPRKRQKKDEKFGFGGKKRFRKSGDAMSSGDLTGFSNRKMKGYGGGGGGGGGSGSGSGSGVKGKGGAAKRMGKARRAGKR